MHRALHIDDVPADALDYNRFSAVKLGVTCATHCRVRVVELACAATVPKLNDLCETTSHVINKG